MIILIYRNDEEHLAGKRNKAKKRPALAVHERNLPNQAVSTVNVSPRVLSIDTDIHLNGSHVPTVVHESGKDKNVKEKTASRGQKSLSQTTLDVNYFR